MTTQPTFNSPKMISENKSNIIKISDSPLKESLETLSSTKSASSRKLELDEDQNLKSPIPNNVILNANSSSTKKRRRTNEKGKIVIEKDEQDDDFLGKPKRSKQNEEMLQVEQSIKTPLKSDKLLSNKKDIQLVDISVPKIDITNTTNTSSSKSIFKYVDSVRKKKEREELPGHECDQCKKVKKRNFGLLFSLFLIFYLFFSTYSSISQKISVL